MTQIKLEVTKDNRDEVLTALEERKDAILEAMGGMAENYAKMLCPVDTGRLRNSITHAQEDESTEIVGTNVEYAAYVEYGTSRSKAQPYLTPAIENHIDEYRQLAEDVLAGNL